MVEVSSQAIGYNISRQIHILKIFAIAITLAGCRLPYIPYVPFTSVAPAALAQLKDANGRTVGNAVFVQDNGSVRVIIDVTGLPPGQKGVHVHAVGRCEPPSFESSGEHFNPTSAQHGSANPRGPHAGDLPNITIDASGRGHLDVTTDGLTLGPGPTSVFDADGSAIIVHAAPDDMRSDPAGNSGGRLACGVIMRASGG